MKSLFIPFIREKIDTAESTKNLVFTHTTDLEAAKSIIETSEIWMTNVPNFSDKDEVKYGKRIMDGLLHGDFGDWLNKVVGNEGLSETFVDYYEECVGKISDGTNDFLYDQSFAFCMRENTFEDMDYMWKNYVNDASVGCMLAFDARYLCGMFRDKRDIDDAMFLLAPLYYFDEKEGWNKLNQEIDGLKNGIEERKKYLYSNDVQIETVLALQSTILLLKHRVSKTEEYFREKEWRIIFSPMIYGAHHSYSKTSYNRKSYPDRLVYDSSKSKYILKLGLWEDGDRCDWNTLLKRVYINLQNDSQKDEIYDDMKSILSRKGIKNVDERIEFV